MSDNDPNLASIDGVDLESCIKATAAVATAGAATAEAAAKVAQGTGIPAGKRQTVSDGWVARRRENMAVRTQVGTLHTKY